MDLADLQMAVTQGMDHPQTFRQQMTTQMEVEQ
jgi:hypothetical protein